MLNGSKLFAKKRFSALKFSQVNQTILQNFWPCAHSLSPLLRCLLEFYRQLQGNLGGGGCEEGKQKYYAEAAEGLKIGGGGDYILLDCLLLLHTCKIWGGHGPPSPHSPPGFDIPAMVLPPCINRRMRQDLFPPFNARFALIFAYQIKIAENVQTLELKHHAWLILKVA